MSDPYRTSAPPESVPDPFPAALPPFSGLFPTCRKCQHKHFAGRTIDRYVAADDALERKCVHCGFVWMERAADSGGA